MVALLGAATVFLSALLASLPTPAEATPPYLPPGSAGDTTADTVLGQVNLFQGTKNFVDGLGLNTDGSFIFGAIAIDQTVVPNRVFVADPLNHRVLGWNNVSAFTTHAAANIVVGQPDLFSRTCNNGGVSAKSLCNPTGVAVDSAGRLYVADQQNHRVLEYNSPFTTDQIADDVLGQFGSFSTNGCNNGGVSSDSLCTPDGIAVDSAGNLYVADFSNNRVLEYNTPETITATAGSGDSIADKVFGQFGSFASGTCNVLGQVNANVLCGPASVTLDSSDNLYVADYNNNRVLEYNTPLTTDATADKVFGQFNFFALATCNLGGISRKSLCGPTGLAIAGAGNLFIADRTNNRALEYNTPLTTDTVADRVFGQNGVFTTNLCNNTFAGTLPPVSTKSLCSPAYLATDSAGNLYLGDAGNNRVLKYNTPITTDTIADAVLGQNLFTTNFADGLDGRGFDFNGNTGAVAIDKSVTPNRIYVVDTNNNRVLAWSNLAAFTTHVPANLVFGQPNFFVNDCNNGGTIANTTLCAPRGAAVDSAGNLYVSDTGNHRVLEYTTPFTTDTTADKVIGQVLFSTGTCNNGGVNQNSLCTPLGVALDGSDNLYVADNSNNRVLEYNTPITTDVAADTVFGQGGAFTTNTCNNGGITANSLCGPHGVAAPTTNLFVADLSNNRVLEYNSPLTTNTTADLVFGQGGLFTTNTANNGGLSADSLNAPRWVAFASGNLFVADTSNNRVLKYNSPLTTNTTADKVFGQGNQFTQNNCKTISPNSLCTPDGIAADATFNLYVPDTANHRVLRYLVP